MTNIVKSPQNGGPSGRAILYTKNHMIDAHLGEYLQLNDIIAQMYDLMSMIETIQMDNNEFVTLKVLILLSPDLGRLKDEQRVQRTQEDVIDALYTYTSSNYKDHLSKFGEIMTLCSYITNVSIHFKTYLFNKLKDMESGGLNGAGKADSSIDATRQSGGGSEEKQTNCGLLMELLKGDLLFQPSYSLGLWFFSFF